ncbi:cytochrome P450 [Gymnopus androsaceus JB14]|uniref:Cytochrome P450 n=1 Tax=Gymnopus androsaceus JB14 TaxID=1447944 RepID=A0A6A4GS31_9AGAR|nr:cytochrome P450 [Gymnopus androsaceus JB14]
MSLLELVNLLALGLFVFLARRAWIRSQTPFPLPPGPKGWPIVGNIFDVPKDKQLHIAYMEMGRKYGNDLLYLNMAGTSLLILNSEEVANDLFVERSTLYSNRPDFPMLFLCEDEAGWTHNSMGWEFNVGLFPYGDRWRKSRALFTQQFSPSNLKTFQKPLLQESTYVFLKKLLDTPKEFEHHIRFFTGGTIISSVYGISFDDPRHESYLALAKHINQAFGEAGIPGTYLVDTFPMLKYIPEWFPGAGFKRKAAYERGFVQRMYNEPVEFVKRNMASGTAKSCVVSRALEEMQDDGGWSEEKEEIMKMVSATMYAAGADTTSATLTIILLALVRDTDIMKKGQAAVEAVVGLDRLPDFGDEGRIPYVDALIMEGLRWRPITPLGVPHHTVSADTYRGYYIPAHTVVIGNTWAFLHNPDTYGEDVTQFRPERFLNPDGTLNSKVPYPDAAFGFGRRVCPGKAFAQSALWLAVASLLACFDFGKVFDEDGVAIEPSTDCIDGLLLRPPPYECTITPRSKAMEGLIRQSFERHI